jgi:hypothetical protein
MTTTTSPEIRVDRTTALAEEPGPRTSATTVQLPGRV